MFDNIFLNLSSTNLVYLFFPNNSEWLPILSKSIISPSIQIRRKSPSIWHSIQPLYSPFNMWGLYSCGIGWSFISRFAIYSKAAIFLGNFWIRLKSFLNWLVGCNFFFTSLIPPSNYPRCRTFLYSWSCVLPL